MENKNKKVIDELEQELKNYARDIGAKTAQTIADKLTETAELAIEMFYKDYTPIYYDRHYYNFRKNSYKRIYENAHNKLFKGGIELTPEAMDDIYQDPTEEVYDMVFAGFHGVSSGYYNPNTFFPTPRMVPSPMDMIMSVYKHITLHLDRYIAKTQDQLKAKYPDIR